MTSRRLRNNNLPGDRRGLAANQEAALIVLRRSWPDDMPTGVILERLGSPPSSVRRALGRLEAEGHVECRGRCWRAVRPSAPVSATPRPGRPIGPLGFREAFLRHMACEGGAMSAVAQGAITAELAGQPEQPPR